MKKNKKNEKVIYMSAVKEQLLVESNTPKRRNRRMSIASMIEIAEKSKEKYNFTADDVRAELKKIREEE